MSAQGMNHADRLISVINATPNVSELLPHYHDRVFTKESLRKLVFKKLKYDPKVLREIFYTMNERLDHDDISLICDPTLSRVIGYKIEPKQLLPLTKPIVESQISDRPIVESQITDRPIVESQSPTQDAANRTIHDITNVPRRPYRFPLEQTLPPPKRYSRNPVGEPGSVDSRAWVANFMSHNHPSDAKEYNFNKMYPSFAWGEIIFNDLHYANMTLDELNGCINKYFPSTPHKDMSVIRSQMLSLITGRCVTELQKRFGLMFGEMALGLAKRFPDTDIPRELCNYHKYCKMIVQWPHLMRLTIDPYIIGKHYKHIHMSFYMDSTEYTKWSGK